MFHSFKVLGKEIILIGVTITANIDKLAAMIRTCNSGGA